MLLTLTVPAVLTPLASAIVTVDRASNAPRNSPRNSFTWAGSNLEFDLLIFFLPYVSVFLTLASLNFQIHESAAKWCRLMAKNTKATLV